MKANVSVSLGDLDFEAGQLDNARTHYDAALKIARSISNR